MRAPILLFVGSISFVLAMTACANALGQSILDTSQQVEVYSASIEIYRGGTLVSKPNVVLPAGEMARIEVANDKNPDSGIRLDLTVSDAGLNKKKARQARIAAVVHEKVGGAWVLLSEPGIIAPLQTRNSMAVDSPLGKLELRFLIVTKLVPASALSGGPQACATSLSQPLLVGGDVPSIRQRCCSAACTNGSGNTLRCCEGSISCCDGVCGACCTTD
jgi:hypothetical protein